MSALREELFQDFAQQLERLEQPLSSEWMASREVSIEEVEALSAKAALILRGYLALSPADRIAFVSQGIFNRRPAESQRAETISTQPNSGAAEEQKPHEAKS